MRWNTILPHAEDDLDVVETKPSAVDPHLFSPVAEIVFDAMRLAAKEAGFEAPEWQDGGNSDMQDVAKKAALRILTLAAK